MLQFSPESLLAAHATMLSTSIAIHFCHKRKIFRNATTPHCCLPTNRDSRLDSLPFVVPPDHQIQPQHRKKPKPYIRIKKRNNLLGCTRRRQELETTSCPTAAHGKFSKTSKTNQVRLVSCDHGEYCQDVMRTRTNDGRPADMTINMWPGGLEKLLVCPRNHRARASTRSQAAAQSRQTLTLKNIGIGIKTLVTSRVLRLPPKVRVTLLTLQQRVGSTQPRLISPL